MQTFVHYFLHFGFIWIIAYVYDRDHVLKCGLILLSTMVVDLDHVFATPFFDPNRCSIGFHPLHTYYAIIIYLLGLFSSNKWIRLFFIGLVFHMITDTIDCFWTFTHCSSCLDDFIPYPRK